MPSSIHLMYEPESACIFHRFLQPARFCHGAFAAAGCDIRIGEGLPDGADWLGVHGLVQPHVLAHLALQRRKGRRVLWSVDDDWLSVPDSNPAKPPDAGLCTYDWLKDMADLIVCSTDHLAGTFRDVAWKVVTAPNLIDPEYFPKPKGFVVRDDGGVVLDTKVELPVRVVWAGGCTHADDLAVMGDALARVLRDVGQARVTVIFYGMAPPPGLMREFHHRGLWHQRGVPLGQWPIVLKSMEPAVYLCPLADVPFNNSKSPLRILESWALGAAPVVSPVGEYAATARPGVDGVTAADEDAWVREVTRLVTDHEYRLTMAVHGRCRLEREFNWQNPDCRRPWYDVFNRVFGTGV